MITNNGYQIVKMERTSEPGSQERGFAIAQAINPETPSQWVTWRYVKDCGFGFFSGNYFSVERMAYKDFYRRLMEKYNF